MDVIDVEAVLEFLSKNGFKESESALREDMFEKGHLGEFDFEQFLFPMNPPPPPLKIPASSRRSGGDLKSTSSGDDDDEFVSLGTSSSEVCNSEFTNPYGIRSVSKADSEVSSDRLSQFGTARDYPDFVLENDLYWYDEKDEGCFMTPSFGASDPFGCPTEDKFVMSSESLGKQDLGSRDMYDNLQGFQSETSVGYLDNPCSFHVPSLSDVDENHDKGSLHMNKDDRFGVHLDEPEGYIAYDCSASGCKLPLEGEGFYDEDPADNGCITGLHDIEFEFDRKDPDDASSELQVKKSSDNLIERTHSKYWVEGFEGITDFKTPAAEKSCLLNGRCEIVFDKKENREQNDPQVVTGGDSLLDDEHPLSDAHDEEYEVFNLRIIHRKNRTGFEENKDLPIVLHTVYAGRYYVTEYLGSAAFSKVVQAHDLLTGVDVCLKIIKNDKDFFDQSLDEIKLLKFVNMYDPADEHHILRLYDYFYYQEHLFIVCELLKANLYEFQKFNQESGEEAYFTLSRLQVITRQILEALEYLHGLAIIHCDLKPENILIKSYRRCEIKVIDLGSSCFKTDNLCLYVQSRSYRAPEVILGLPYDQKIDLWSLGCILAELYCGEVLFPNDGVVMILARMIGMIGPIDLDMLEKGQETSKYFTKEYDLYHINEESDQLEYIIPESSSLEHHLQVTDVRFIDFLKYLLEINPKRRPNASEALQHPWLDRSY